ncbi:MAG: proton-conducting transporter membrane subunit [Bacteroidia bacterium]|nr:proton-conducting transporter membrane subunit [Bacteroidia bacterium]
MWGLDRLWPEMFLMGVALGQRWRGVGVVGLLAYGAGVSWQVGETSFLLSLSSQSVPFVALMVGLTVLAWLCMPLRGGASWAMILQVASYGLLLRSTHLAFSWALLEVAALSGYFWVFTIGSREGRLAAAIRYFTWSVMGSALLLLGIGSRLAIGKGLQYPLESGGGVADALLGWGWAIKMGFIPFHFWLIGVYRVIPLVWAAWFSVVPKGALLFNLLALLPPEGGLQSGIFYFLGAVSLVGGYALAWRGSTLADMLFWGTFSQVAYITLVSIPGAQPAGRIFWIVYGAASFLSFLYVERPWRGRVGNAVGLLLLANLAGLPPVAGFWVKFRLFWEAFLRMEGNMRILLVGAAGLATIAGFMVYGHVLWRLWQEPSSVSVQPAFWWKCLYLAGALGLLGVGLWGF